MHFIYFLSYCSPLFCSKIFSNCYCLVTQSCPTACDPMDCSTPGFPVHQQLRSLLKVMSMELVMPSNHLILYSSLLLFPSIFPSLRVFPMSRIRWPKNWSFSFSISSSNEYSGLISVRTDWLDLLSVQGTLKSLLQHHSSKTSLLSAQHFLWSDSHIHI